MIITNEQVEKQELEFNEDLSRGINVARKNGINLTKFKQIISKGLSTKNDEDQWTWDYESYLCTIATGKFESPSEWAIDFYQGRWES